MCLTVSVEILHAAHTVERIGYPVIQTGPATDWKILRVKNCLLACMHNNLIGMFLETLIDLERMQFSLNDIPAHLQKCGIPMTYKIIHL
jgi:hypothetical protein